MIKYADFYSRGLNLCFKQVKIVESSSFWFSITSKVIIFRNLELTYISILVDFTQLCGHFQQNIITLLYLQCCDNLDLCMFPLNLMWVKKVDYQDSTSFLVGTYALLPS